MRNPTSHLRPAAIEPLEARIAPAALTWTKNGDGFWDDASNWSTGHVPTMNDDVTLGAMAAAYTVTVRSGAQEVHSLTASAGGLSLTGGSLTLDAVSSAHAGLTLSGGGLVLKAAFDTYGTVAWSSNASGIAGAGTLTSHGMTELSASLVDLDATYINAGTFHTNGGGLGGGSTGVLTNAAGATMTLEGGANFVGGTLTNAGTLNSTGGDQDIRIPFNNSGTLHLTGGTILLRFGTNSGTFNLDAGTQLSFSVGPGGGTYTLAAGSQLNGTGLYDVSGFVVVDIASGVEVSPAKLKLESFSSIGGAGQITIASGSTLEWIESANVAGSGKIKVAAGGTAHVLGAPAVDAGETLEVDGTLNVDEGGSFRAHAGSTVNVGNGGVVNLIKGATITGDSAGDSVHVLVGGEILAVTSGYTATVSIAGDNAGKLHAAAGSTLRVYASIKSQGVYQADAGSTFVVTSNAEMLPGAIWSGPGQFQIPSGTVTLDSGETLTPMHLTLTGSLGGAGNLEIASGATLTLGGNRIQANGVMFGTGKTHIASGGIVTGSALNFSTGRVLVNDGTITVSTVQTDTTSTGAFGSLTNDAGGVLNLIPGGEGFAQIGSRATLVNAGTLHLDASGPLGASIYAFVNNTGLLTVSGGTALISPPTSAASPSSSSGEIHVDTGATLHFAEDFQFNSGATFTGTGLFNFDTTTQSWLQESRSILPTSGCSMVSSMVRASSRQASPRGGRSEARR